jgi:hypothetical protein
MTKEELYNNYEYKVIVRAIKQEFPFIKNIYVRDDETINKYESYIFLDADINPFEMSQKYNLRLYPILLNYLKRGEPYWGSYLSLFTKGGPDETSQINRAIEELIVGIHNSPAIPQELKLNKTLEITGWHAHPSTLPDTMSPIE